MARWSWVLALGLVGCSGDGDGTTPTDTTDTTDPTGCTSTLVSSWPEDGATGLFYRTVVDATLAAEEPDATLVVTDASGAEVPGTVLRDGGRITFVADAPYVAGATYTSRLEWSCDPVEATFTIATGVGDPVDPSGLVGRSWKLDLKEGRFVAPAGIGQVLQNMLEVELLLGVQGQDPAGLALAAGVAAEAGGQDLCSPTTDFDDPGDYAQDPFWTVYQPALPLVVLGDPITVRDLSLSGAFAPGGSTIEGVAMSGEIDTRDLKDAVGVGDDDEAVCNLFSATFGVRCEACGSGDGDFCITLVVDTLTMAEESGPLVPRSAADIAADPACAAAR